MNTSILQEDSEYVTSALLHILHQHIICMCIPYLSVHKIIFITVGDLLDLTDKTLYIRTMKYFQTGKSKWQELEPQKKSRAHAVNAITIFFLKFANTSEYRKLTTMSWKLGAVIHIDLLYKTFNSYKFSGFWCQVDSSSTNKSTQCQNPEDHHHHFQRNRLPPSSAWYVSLKCW
jgi:hypothetical protein